MIERAEGESLPRALYSDSRFAQMYHAYHSLVYATCLGVLRDAAEAEDATQETFLRAFRQRGSVPEKPGPWLRVVARNHSLDVRRRRMRAAQAAADMAVLVPAGDDPGDRALDRADLQAALDGLGSRERHVLWGSAVEDRSVASLAHDLGLSYMGTAQLLHRARQRARRLLTGALGLFIPLLPPHLRGRGHSARWLQYSQVSARFPELATAAAVAAVLVAGPLLGSGPAGVPGPGLIPAEAAAPNDAGGSKLTVAASNANGGAAGARTSVAEEGSGQVGGSSGSQGQGGSGGLGGLGGLDGAAGPLNLSLPGPLSVNATSPAGANVSFSVDVAGGQGGAQVSCTPASGSLFPIGTTTVNCAARDSKGHTGSGSFPVTVVGAPPVAIQVPGAITVTSPDGGSVQVTFQVTGSGGYGQIQVSCNRASGSFFTVGVTQVTCTATDAFGQSASAGFTVTVTVNPSVIAILDNMISEITNWEGPVNGAVLIARLNAAKTAIQAGHPTVACASMNQFREALDDDHHLTGQQRGHLHNEEATVRHQIGCHGGDD